MKSIKTKAFSLLARRSYFSKELRQKLLQKGYQEKEIDTLIHELVDQGWVNDRDLAQRFVKGQQERGYGRRVIKQKLLQKAGTICVDIEDGDIESLIEKKYKQRLFKEREKVIAALMRRGFSWDLINKTLEVISNTKQD